MTTKEFASLERSLLPSFPGFAVKGRLMFIPPAHHTLRGFNFEPSGFDKNAFYVTSFFLPLCVPRKHLSYEFANRINGSGWRADTPNLQVSLAAAMLKEVPFLSSLRTLKDVVEAAKFACRDSDDLYRHEAIAYLLAQSGEVTEAAVALENLWRRFDLTVPWQREMADRARSLKAELLSDHAGAQRQLKAWEDESVRNLGLK